MFLTALLIISSIVVRGMSSCTVQVPDWIENTTSYVGSNKVGQLLLTKHLIERVSAYWRCVLMIYCLQSFLKLCSQQTLNNESGTDDDINLVESQDTEKPAKKTNLWRTFGKIIDRVLFSVFTILYVVMIWSLLPEGYFDRNDTPSVEIIGY